MRRFITTITALLALIFTTSPMAAASSSKVEFSAIETRMLVSMKRGAPSASEVETIIKSINPAGGFIEIDYQSEVFNSGDKKRVHFAKSAKLAKSYLDPNSKYYQSEELYSQIESLLSFWLESDLDDANWWHRSIGFPKDMMPTLVMLKAPLMERNPQLYNDLVDYLDYSWTQTPPRFRTGANGTDISKIAFTKAVLSGDGELLQEVMTFVSSLIFLAEGGTQEGIYPDFSFSQHSGNGRQLYLGTYGREYLDGTLFFMEFTNGTSFAIAPEKVALIEDLVISGVAWMWYRGETDANQCGRKIYDKENFATSFVPITERIIALNTPKNKELKGVLSMMKGESEITGNRAYPYHDYMIHRGKGYMTTIRMTSTRTVGNEAGNGQGLENYHTGDGATYFKVHGDEYSPIFPTWNWRKIPGTTVIVDDAPLTPPMWGAHGLGGNDYAAVASTGSTGVAGFIYEKDQAKAHKAWFNFNDYTVALGAGICSSRSDAPLITTINQTTLKGKVAEKGDAIWHYDIAYQSLCDKQIKSEKIDNILLLTFDHGTEVQNDSYAYAIYPKASLKRSAALSKEIEILSNSEELQAVKNSATGEVMAIFYSAGSLNIDNGTTLNISQGAAITCTPTKSGYDVVVGNPYCESKSNADIKVSVTKDNKEVALKVTNVAL